MNLLEEVLIAVVTIGLALSAIGFEHHKIEAQKEQITELNASINSLKTARADDQKRIDAYTSEISTITSQHNALERELQNERQKNKDAAAYLNTPLPPGVRAIVLQYLKTDSANSKARRH